MYLLGTIWLCAVSMIMPAAAVAPVQHWEGESLTAYVFDLSGVWYHASRGYHDKVVRFRMQADPVSAELAPYKCRVP